MILVDWPRDKNPLGDSAFSLFWRVALSRNFPDLEEVYSASVNPQSNPNSPNLNVEVASCLLDTHYLSTFHTRE